MPIIQPARIAIIQPAWQQLWVAGHCALAGAGVRFIDTADHPTPDIHADFPNGGAVTLEVKALGQHQEMEARHQRTYRQFKNWKPGSDPRAFEGTLDIWHPTFEC